MDKIIPEILHWQLEMKINIKSKSFTKHTASSQVQASNVDTRIFLEDTINFLRTVSPCSEERSMIVICLSWKTCNVLSSCKLQYPVIYKQKRKTDFYKQFTILTLREVGRHAWWLPYQLLIVLISIILFTLLICFTPQGLHHHEPRCSEANWGALYCLPTFSCCSLS